MPKDQLLINTGDTSFDKIWAHYKDPSKYKLTEKQTQLKERWLAAFTLRQNFHSRQQAANIMMEKYDVSRAQAFIDLRNAERLFGNVMKADRQGSLAILREYAHKMYLMAVKAKDLKAIGKSLELLGKYSEIDKDNSLTFNPEKLENKQIKLVIKKSTEELIINHLTKGSLDFNKIVDGEAEVLENEE
jgi:hypothetical protein